MIETLLYYVLVDSISFKLQEVLCIWRILESDDQAFVAAGNDKKARNKKTNAQSVSGEYFKRVCQKCKQLLY